MLDVLIDLSFIIDVFSFSRGAVLLFPDSPNDLLQFVQFLLEGLNIFLNFYFELVCESLGFILKPKLIQLCLEDLPELCSTFVVNFLLFDHFAVVHDVAHKYRQIICSIGRLSC